MEVARRLSLRILDRFQPTRTSVMLVTAIAVGGGTGVGAVLFIRLIDLVQRSFLAFGAHGLGFLGRAAFIVFPMIGGLLAGPVISRFAREAKGHGVPEVMAAIALRGGRIRPRVVVAKVLASALCIGSGGSAGREGPIVQVGSALGSTLGQWFRFSSDRIRTLVACGAASGIAATFNAPIAGVIFSAEIILGELHLGDLGSVVVSAVTAATVARVFLGDRPSFAIPDYGVRTPWEVLLYALLGVLAAFAAIGFIRILYWFEDRFDGWKAPDSLKPAVGGLMLGILAFAYPGLLASGWVPPAEAHAGSVLADNIPHVFGSGFPTIEGALLGQLSLGLLLVLVLLKPLATSLTLGSGNSGGVFAPALFTGAALGGAFGRVVELLAPGATAGPGAFATVGMAAVFAGAARAPFTAILIVFEMTGDYRLIVPLMAGVVISTILAERLHKESVYTLKLVRRGIRLNRGRDVDVLEGVRVDEVMVREPATVPENLPVQVLGTEFLRTGRHGFAVVREDGTLSGVVSLQDYREAAATEPDRLDAVTVGEIATREVVTTFPDEPVGTALRRMAPRDLSRLPVVSREDPARLVGMVRRNDIVRAYEVGVVRREEVRRRAAVTTGGVSGQAEFFDAALTEGSPAVGRTVAELRLPREAVLVSIRRGHELLIPRGDTTLRAGDVVTALCEHAALAAARAALRGPA